MTQYSAEIEWKDTGGTMEVIFDDDCDWAENDDDVFFYGWIPKVEEDFNYDGWRVVEVYGEL